VLLISPNVSNPILVCYRLHTGKPPYPNQFDRILLFIE
jgi:hypothetical protein